MEKKKIITFSKDSNIALRGEKIKSGYSLFLDINFLSKRYREYLKLHVSTDNKRKFTETDRTMYRIATKIKSKRVIEIADGTYLTPKIFSGNTYVSKYYGLLKDERIQNKDKSHYKWTSSFNYFCKYAKSNITFNDINRKFLEGYRAYLLNNLSQNSASTYFSILSQVFEKARIDKIIQFNPMTDVKSIKQYGSLKTYLTEDEVSKLIETDNRGTNGEELFPEVSIRAFIFGCYTGIRFSDIRSLKGTQIKNENSSYYLYFISAKAKHSDRVKLHPIAVKQLQNIGDDVLLFPGLFPNDVVNNHLKKWYKKAGLTKHVTFHVSKHTFATLALNSGVDIYTLKELLHHNNIRTTEGYAKLLSQSKDKAIDMLPNL